MKFFLLFFVLSASVHCEAQKYALLDQHLAQPVTFTNKVTSDDKFNDRFPVEKKMLPQFINTLTEIQEQACFKEAIRRCKAIRRWLCKIFGYNR